MRGFRTLLYLFTHLKRLTDMGDGKRIIIPLTEDDKCDILRMYHEGKSTVEISEYIGCSRTTVYYYLKKKNMINRIKWTTQLDDAVITYYKSRLSRKEISSTLGLPLKRVTHRIGYLRKLGKL